MAANVTSMRVLLALPPRISSSEQSRRWCLKQMAAVFFIRSYGGLPPKSERKIGSPPKWVNVSMMMVLAPPPNSMGRMRLPPRSETWACPWWLAAAQAFISFSKAVS